MKKSVLLLLFLLTTNAFAGGVKVFPMSISNAKVGVPTAITLINEDDKSVTVEAISREEKLLVFPPVIPELKPGEKRTINVAFSSIEHSKDTVVIAVGDTARYHIRVKSR